MTSDSNPHQEALDNPEFVAERDGEPVQMEFENLEAVVEFDDPDAYLEDDELPKTDSTF